MKEKKTNVFLKGLRPNPKEKIEINSLSLFNLLKHKSNPKIIINGIIVYYPMAVGEEELEVV